MPSPIVESFSITHAAILDGSTGGDIADIYGVREGTVEIDSDSYSNTGDDAILSVWNWFNLATITVSSGFINFDTLSLITGAVVTSSGNSPSDYWNLPLWNKSSLNQPTRPLLLRTAAKKNDGSVGFLSFILYKVQFQPLRFDGPSYKNGLTVSYTGQALLSPVDEIGNSLTDSAVGRIVYSTLPTTRTISNSTVTVVNNNDGTFSVTGDNVVDNGNSYTVNSSQFVDNGDGTYTITY